jgi:hypothetical protein
VSKPREQLAPELYLGAFAIPLLFEHHRIDEPDDVELAQAFELGATQQLRTLCERVWSDVSASRAHNARSARR